MAQILPSFTLNDKNFSIHLDGSFRVREAPEGYSLSDITVSSSLELKARSSLLLSQIGKYYNTPFTNTGPLPPRVNKETTYVVVWRIQHRPNDIDSLALEAELPPTVLWKNVSRVNRGTLSFDAARRMVVWDLGKKAGASSGMLPDEAAFQIGLIPAANQVNTTPTLIEEVRATAHDIFVDETLAVVAPAVRIDLPDDPAILFNQHTVAP